MFQSKALQRSFAASAVAAMLAASVTLPLSAQAQSPTHAQLQAQITALLAQIQTLQAQLGQSGSTAGTCPYTWTRNLTIGTTGADVMNLQQFLNSNPDTQVAVSGAGSKGQETQYYGPATGAAVAKFQTKYRSEVLTPNGLTTGTTFFGPATRAKANNLCVSAPVVTPTTPTTPETPAQPETPATPAEEELSGAATVERFKVSSGEDTNLEENQKNAEVMDIEFTVVDGDLTLNRVDIAFAYVSGAEDEPWKTFEEVSLWHDGKRIARKTANVERNWTEDSPYAGAHTIRFTNLKVRVDEDETFEFTVAVDVEDNVDGANDGLSWDLFVPNTGIRILDADNVSDSFGDETDTVNVDINAEGSEDELAIRSSNEDPESGVLQVESSKTSDWMTIFAFDLDAEDSTNDIEVRRLPVAITVGTGTVDTFMQDARVSINGKTYRDFTKVDGATNYLVFNFRSNEVVVEAGERETVELQVRFRALDEMYEGTTIEATASSSAIRAEGANDLTDTQLSGAATSDLHELRTLGAEVKNSNTSSATLKTNNSADLTDDEGIFKMTFSVTAFETDLYIKRSAERGTSLGTGGTNYVILDTAGDVTTAGTSTASLSSTARTSGSYYLVREGETKEFTLTVNYDPATSDFYAMRLHSFNYAKTAVDPTSQQRALPTSKYETPTLSI